MRVALRFLCGELRVAEGRAEMSWSSAYAAGGVGRRAEFVWLFQGDWRFGGGRFFGRVGSTEVGWAERAAGWWMGGRSEEEVGLEWWD